MAFRSGIHPTETGTERKTISSIVSHSITTELKKYGIGNKLRRLRLRKSMGLVDLSKHTGLSPALLSKLERDVMHPTLPTLTRIAMVFSIGLEYFSIRSLSRYSRSCARRIPELSRVPGCPPGCLLLRKPGFPGSQPHPELLSGRVQTDYAGAGPYARTPGHRIHLHSVR